MDSWLFPVFSGNGGPHFLKTPFKSQINGKWMHHVYTCRIQFWIYAATLGSG